MDLDLNREPVQGHAAGESEDSQGRIQERIRLLESVVARGRYRRPPFPSSSASSPIHNSSRETANVVASIPQPQPDHRVNPCKIDGGTHLLAKALAMDSSCEQNQPSTSTSTSPYPSALPRKPGGSAFDCNICFSLSKDPVLTCCGHLFCWPCFYCLPNSDSYYSKECPVCQGEVLETEVTPIYGGGSSLALASSSSIDPRAIKIPPRPPARRIDSTRSRLGYPTLPPHHRAPQVFGVHPSWLPLPTSNTLAVTGANPPRPSPSPSPVLTEGINVVTVNSMASLYPPLPRTQTEASLEDALSESPATVRIDDSYPTETRRSSSSSRRARNDIGLTFRNQRRRRGDWLS